MTYSIIIMHLRVNVSGGKPPTNSHVLNGLGNWEMKNKNKKSNDNRNRNTIQDVPAKGHMTALLRLNRGRRHRIKGIVDSVLRIIQ